MANRSIGALRRAPQWTLPLVVMAAAVGGLFVPGPTWVPTLAHAESASAFLEALWQVVAASAGLSITVVFFALQSLSTTRGSGVRDSGLTGRFQAAIYLSIGSLVAIGLDLLHVGHDAPAGWSAAWATGVSALAILSVVALIAGLVSVMSPAFLQRRRLNLITREAEAHVERDALYRVAFNALDRFQQQIGFEWSLFGTKGRPAIASAPREGIVSDIRIRRLRKVAKRASALGLPDIRVRAHLGMEVAAESGLIFAESSDRELAHLARNVVRISSRRRVPDFPSLDALAAELHAEAIQAIRDARLAEFEMVAESQRALLLAVPMAWRRQYRQIFSGELATELFPLRIGPIGRVSRNMYEQMRVSLGIGVLDLTLKVAYEPLFVASSAIKLSAIGLAKELLQTAGSVVMITATDEVSLMTRDHAWMNLNQLSKFTIEPIVEAESQSDQNRTDAAALVGTVISIMARISRHAITARDPKLFDEVDRHWASVLEYWLTEQAADYQPECLAKRIAIDIKKARDQAQLAVAIWLIRDLKLNPTDSNLNAMFAGLRMRQRPIQAVLEGQAYEPTDLLDSWIMDEMPSGEVHSIDSMTPRLAGISLLLIDACRSASKPLAPTRWLLDNRDGLLRAIDAHEQAYVTRSLLSLTEVEVRDATDRARSVLQAAAQQQEEDDDRALRSAQVSEEQQAQFHEWVSEEWSQNRSLRRLLQASGMQVDAVEGVTPGEQLGVAGLASKLWIVDSRGELGFEQLGHEFGRILAAKESDYIAALICDHEERDGQYLAMHATAAEAETQLARAVEDLRDSGYIPSVILRGSSPAIWRAIRAEALSPDERDKLPDEAVGRWGGILVARPGYIDGTSLAVLDAASWAKFRDGNVDRDSVKTSLTTYDDESGWARLEAEPSLFANLASVDDRLKELNRHMHVEGSVTVGVEVLDCRAVRVVRVTDQCVE